jgi:hypothetical protein
MAIKTRETTATGVTNKGSPLTNAELDNNFVELVANKVDLTDLSVTTNSAGTAALSYNNSSGVFTYTPPDLSGYLTSFTETNDLTAAVTWANVPNANITEGSVTQHQAALSVTESQISDLGAYITASSSATLTNKSGNISQWTNDSGYLTSFTETNDLTASVTWANVPDANITQSSVTQHQAALSVAASQLSDVTSTAAELNLLDGSTADTVVNSKAVIYGAAGQVTASELDVDNIQIDANAVKSTNTNGNIQLFPNGTGFTELYGNTNAGAIRFNCENNSHGVTLKGPAHSAGATYSLELPDGDGTSGQVLQTNGSGKLSFADTAGGGGGSLEATASGALSNGDLIIVNANGTVSAIAETINTTPSAGTSVVFENAQTIYIAAAYDSASGKIVIAYRDDGNSSYGTAVVGTVSGTSISFGTPVVFESANSTHIAITSGESGQRVVIAYCDTANTNNGTAIVGTISGTSISFGSAAVFETSRATNISATYDANASKVVIAYAEGGNTYGTAIVGNVSGTSISFGGDERFETDGIAYSSVAYDANAQKVVIAYGSGSNGTAVVATVSGTSISFGTPVVFESSASAYFSAVYDTNAQKIVIAYEDDANSDYGTAIVGTVSGTSISFGTAVVYESANTKYHAAAYDANAQKVVIAYTDDGNSGKGTAIVGTVSGTSISFSTPAVFVNGDSTYIAIAYDSNAQKSVIACRDNSNSYVGTAAVFTAQSTATNLTSENYIGIADAAYSDGATATVQIVGSVDDAQSSLTPGQQYFVQLDGSLGTTAADPSVFAGTAVAATKIIVKG